MKNKFYIMTALVISLTGCSNIEDGTQPTVKTLLMIIIRKW